MTRSAEAAKGLYVKQKEQGLPFIIPNNSVGMNQLNEEVKFGLMPLGTVFAVATNITGAFAPPATGVIKDGFMICDGATIPNDALLQGSVPTLNDNRFLMGASIAGNTGGANSITLTEGQLPAHVHTINHGHLNTFALGNATVASSSHRHNMAHTHFWGRTNTAFTLSSWNSSDVNRTTTGSSVTIFSNLANTSVTSPGQARASGNTAASTTYYTSGAIDAPQGSGSSANTGTPSATTTVTLSGSVTSHSGNSGSVGSGEAIDVRPLFLSTVFLIRVK